MASSVRGYMKHTLDPLFSKYIRIQEAVKSNGYVRCVTCGKIDKWEDMDAGHYVSRNRWATKYDERNVHIQCPACNRFKSGCGADYAVFLISEYGQHFLIKLVHKSREYKKFSLDDLKKMAKIYRAKIRELGYGHII